jgi:hypothetical protein
MSTLTRKLGLTVGFMLAAVQSVASAAEVTQWTIVYAPTPPSTPVPTLSEWGLLILAVVMAMAAAVYLRKKGASKTLASVAFLSALVLGGFSGDKLIGNARALPTPAMTNPAGGTLSFGYTGQLAIPNISGVSQTIVSITPTVLVATPGPTCVVGLVVPAGGQCYISDALASSDRRLKKDIVYLATLDTGIKVYSFKYLRGEDTHVGVMAQDLLQSPEYKDAVVLGADGYYRVNYRALGLRMISLTEWNQSSKSIFDTTAAGGLAFQRVSALGSR